MSTDTPVVLVLDDERELAKLYAEWLSSRWNSKIAYDVDGAIDRLDSSVDVALVDRRLPRRSGDEFIQYVEESEFDPRVAMVTAVKPDFDIVEMGFDEYVVKPIDRERLYGVVDSLLTRSTYDRQIRHLYRLISKRSSLETCKSDAELAESDSYSELNRRIQRLQSELDSTTNSLSSRDFDVELRRIGAD